MLTDAMLEEEDGEQPENDEEESWKERHPHLGRWKLTKTSTLRVVPAT